MTASGTFYVYEHWRLDRGECFYVGKGKRNRAYRMRDRNKHHQAIMTKLAREGSGMEVKLVQTGLTEDEAFKLERERIAFWREAGIDLANLTDGGEGQSGLPSPQRKGVICIDTGNVFESADAATKHFGLSVNAVSQACSGRSESANGLRFRYVSEPEKAKIPRISAEKRKKVEVSKSYGSAALGIDALGRSSAGPKKISKPVICLDTGETFPSASEAARYFNICKSSIIELCLGKNKRVRVGGLKFKYEDK